MRCHFRLPLGSHGSFGCLFGGERFRVHAAAAFCHSTVVVVVFVVALLWVPLFAFAFAFAFFSACHTVLLLNAVGTYVWVSVCVYMWSVPWQLGTQTYLCGYVLLHIFSKFYNSQVHARQAGSENSAPTRSCLICIQRTLPHTPHQHPLILYPPTRMTNNF